MERDLFGANIESPPMALTGAPFQPRRLPPVRKFVVVWCNWTAFQRRFMAAYKSMDWTEVEAVHALPTALDNDSLKAFKAILEVDRANLPRAYAQMTAIFNPPSNSHRRFLLRRRGEAKMPFIFRSVLLALGQAAYPHMDRVALDSLVLERLLSLPQESSVALSITEEDDLSSLKVARCIQAHLNLQQWPTLAACVGEPADLEEPALREPERACTSFVRDPRARGVKGWQPERE
ncbi:unnamed protein product [Lampetra planeri]